MKRKLLLLMTAVIMLGSTAYAQRGPSGIFEDLNLTDDQQQRIDDLRYQHRKAMIKRKAELEEAKLEFRRIMRNVEIDEKAALERHNKMSSLKAEMAQSKVKQKLAIRKVLNKEQTEKLLKARRGKERSRGHGSRGERPRHGMKHGECMGSSGGPGPGYRQR